MKPYSYTISKPSEIGGVIRAFRSLGASGCSLLISIFTAYTKKEGLQEMVDALSLSFPEAEISGMTSSVCIEQGVNRTEKIIILFEVFEKTYIHTICFDHAPGKEDAVGWAVMGEINKISRPLCGIEILASQSDDRFSDFSPFLNVLTHELPGALPRLGRTRGFTDLAEPYLCLFQEIHLNCRAGPSRLYRRYLHHAQPCPGLPPALSSPDRDRDGRPYDHQRARPQACGLLLR